MDGGEHQFLRGEDAVIYAKDEKIQRENAVLEGIYICNSTSFWKATSIITTYSHSTKPDSPDPFQEGVLCVKLLQEEDLRPLCFTLHFSLQTRRVSAGEEPREGGDLGVQEMGLFSA